MRRVLFAFALAALMLPTAAAGAAEQRAFALRDPVTVYARPEEGARSWEASLPAKGVAVPSAIRDKNDELWYKVTVDGRTGWIPHEGIRLRMGPKSKWAANTYKRLAALRARVLKDAPEAWSQGGSIDDAGGEVTTFTMNGGLFQILRKGSRTEDIYFRANSAEACRAFLGFNPIGMDKDEIRSKVGTPTVRETPAGDRAASILSYEIAGQDMTAALHLRNDVVEWFELYRGGAGDAAKGWSPDVLYERDQI